MFITINETDLNSTAYNNFFDNFVLPPLYHVISDSVFVCLLQEVTTQPGMGFDPLPPLDSIMSYTRPERYLHAKSV